MELSASYSVPLGPNASAFFYAGLPGEPAFGPPAFMHRMAIADSPEAPITHHWLDSTHITFGVVTAGLVLGNVKLEASRFNGREPDERRWNIETGPLDFDRAARLAGTRPRNLSLQASWAHLVSPEQLEPHENSNRWSASALWTRRLGPDKLGLRHPRLGQSRRRRRRRCGGRARPWPVDPLRPRRICREQ